ncbi:MAG TPA: hypothetical protein VJ821_13685 [Anaerolineales bacterium]|nr:hypothetical protein [Anaerolineales bacterium]
MNELEQELFETRIVALAAGLEYPRTPDIAGSVMARLRPVRRSRVISRRLAWSLAVVLALCSSLMLIPPARAAIIEFIQIGVVRIFGSPSTPPAPVEGDPSTAIPPTATPSPTLPPLIPILEDIAGEMTLEEAQQSVTYPILLPSYPSGLGIPDRVFVQDADGDMAILVWLDPQEPERVSMSLHFIPAGSWAIDKVKPATIQQTSVDGERALWTVGPYPLRLSSGDITFTRLINGHVLIWEKGNITCRLETELPLEEAIRIAESLVPIP